MPWKETGPVSERLRFISLVENSNDSFSEVCREFGISRKTGYKWLRRYDEEGPAALEDRPPIAQRIRHKIPKDLVAKILDIRKEHPTWGPRKIRATIGEHTFWRVPASSTIGSILKQYGLIETARRRWRVPCSPTSLEPADEANDTWCIDFKGHFKMKCGLRCHPLTVSDEHTRYLLKCESLVRPDEQHVRPHLERAFREFGLPHRIRSDNGPPFSTRTLAGLSELAVWWIRLGIKPERIAPGHPEQNGRHERMHRTLKEDVPPEADSIAQQLAFDRFRYVYNEQRPHEALDLRPPAKVYRASPRTMPVRVPEIEYPSAMKVRKVDVHGYLSFGGKKHVLISKVLSRQRVGLDQIDDDSWMLYLGTIPLARIETKEDSVVVRSLQIDS